MDRYGVFDEDLEASSVVYADDQFVNQQFMRLNFEDFSLQSKLVQFSNGLETVNFFETLLENPSNLKSKCPIRLLILDINMPGLNGLQCNERVRELYR